VPCCRILAQTLADTRVAARRYSRRHFRMPEERSAWRSIQKCSCIIPRHQAARSPANTSDFFAAHGLTMQIDDVETSDFTKGERESMRKPFKIVRRAEREQPETRSENGPLRDSNQWSRAVRSWVAEFRKHSDNQSVPAFNQVFFKQRLS
jgi:hypothetical protein